MTSGDAQRRNGLVSSSSPIVEGTVGSFPARRAASRRLRAASFALRGSTAHAKRMLDIVYSWAQYTRVSRGSRASRESESSICAGVPSKSRPHPHAKSVSPQNTKGPGGFPAGPAPSPE